MHEEIWKKNEEKGCWDGGGGSLCSLCSLLTEGGWQECRELDIAADLGHVLVCVSCAYAYMCVMSGKTKSVWSLAGRWILLACNRYWQIFDR